MSIIYEERGSDSLYIETVTRGWTIDSSVTIRPAEIHWHMVFAKLNGHLHPMVTGSTTTAGNASWEADAEVLWIKFRLGTFMPHLAVKKYVNTVLVLPDASSRSFWLNGMAWEFPSYDNVETFVERLVHDDLLVRDPIVHDALQGRLSGIPPRTVRHRFLQSVGLSQNHVRQFERAQRAIALLQRGMSIIDTAYQAGYFDQPHLTRAVKQFTGYTPAQFVQLNKPE
jgi:AraC-like DNA-binding protein